MGTDRPLTIGTILGTSASTIIAWILSEFGIVMPAPVVASVASLIMFLCIFILGDRATQQVTTGKVE